MKKISIIVMAIGLLMLLSIAAPVFAESPNKVSYTLATSNVQTDHSEATIVETPNAVHVWGAIRTANAKLTISPSTPLERVFLGTVRVNLDYKNNTKALSTIQHYHKFVVTFPAQTGLPNGGVFEGVNTWTALPFESHFVLQGSGDFEGYTMYLDRDFEKGVVSWLLIH